MVITYFGNGCFRLQSGESSVLIDPEGNRLKADVTLFTKATLKDGDSFAQDVVSFPGEYEAKGIEIDGMGIPGESKKNEVRTAYLVRMEDIRVGVLGNISKIPPADVLERMEEPDILILPVAKGEFLSSEDAAKFAKQVEPAVVIVGSYKNTSEIQKGFGKKSEPQEKFVCKKKDLESGKAELVILEPK
ncbi:MAG: MBL fold metallo-hydrolase [Candidatus Liptonbacteria bacterium]|nr:MBL fold metallo-hydrolase [Candidatus Liptonbacteria bacterium]